MRSERDSATGLIANKRENQGFSIERLTTMWFINMKGFKRQI